VELRYASNELERQCTDARHMQRRLGVERAKKLRLRIAELRRAVDFDDLLVMPGLWEMLSADRSGQWSGRLTRNWRLIVRPEVDDQVAVLVVEIVDYH